MIRGVVRPASSGGSHGDCRDLAPSAPPWRGVRLARLGQVLQGKGLAPDMAQLGSYQIFQGLVMTQTSVPAIMDVFWAFELLAIAGIVLVLATWRRAKPAAPVSAPVRATDTSGLRGIAPALLHP